MAALAALSAARVASILHEPQLTGPDDGSATLANLLPEGLIAVQQIIRSAGYDPDDVTNGEDFDHLQAAWIGWRYFEGLPDSAAAAKAERHRLEWVRQTDKRLLVRPVTGAGDAQARGGRRIPVVLNHDSEPVFARGSDTRRGGSRPRHYRSGLI